jgi:hypothetical protein
MESLTTTISTSSQLNPYETIKLCPSTTSRVSTITASITDINKGLFSMMYPHPGNINNSKIVIPGLVSPTDSQKTINSHLASATRTSNDPAVLLAQQTIQTLSSASSESNKQPQITIIQPRTTPTPLMPRPTTGKKILCTLQSIVLCKF